MKKLYAILFFIFFTTCLVSVYSGINYTDPVNGAKYINPENGIIIGFSSPLNSVKYSSELLRVSGGISGVHSGTITFTKDRTKLLFKPDNSFIETEKVTVQLLSDLYLNRWIDS